MKKTYLWFLYITMLLALSACSTMATDTVPTLTPAETSTAVPTPTAAPTPTEKPALGILLAPPDADQALADIVQAVLADSSTDSGIRFQVLPSLDVDSFEQDVIRWVVALSPAPNLDHLGTAAPQTSFLAVGIPGLNPAPNLSIIAPGDSSHSQQSFIAGYIAALITPEWHVGVISISDSAEGQDARNAFLTGAEYYCGMCAPTYPPYFNYPLYVE
ncbi:MAG: hypothetical protein ABFS03_12900, partial [Chloroflexota bacterium]